MDSGTLEVTTFRTSAIPEPVPQVVEVPNPYNTPRGQVLALEWSSDGYALAVGWEHGWGIISLGGRCLVSSFGIDDTLKNARSAAEGCYREFGSIMTTRD